VPLLVCSPSLPLHVVPLHVVDGCLPAWYVPHVGIPLRLYLDTSVLGAEFDTELPERVSVTRMLFELLARKVHRACLCPLGYEELGRAPSHVRAGIERRLATFDLEVLTMTPAAAALANAYLGAGALPAGALADAWHLAVASVHAVDVLVSWNFQHMVNPVRRRAVHAVNLAHGRPLIEIASPYEIVESDAGEGDTHG